MRGGKREGAGRKPGAPNKAGRVARARAASLTGKLPHELLLAIARGERVNGHLPTFEQQIVAMEKAAPFYASRFASKHEHMGAAGGPIAMVDFSGLSDEQLASLQELLTIASADTSTAH